VTVLKSGDTTQSFAYDAYGNLISNAETGTAVTTMTYDLANHLTGIDAAGTATDATFALDTLRPLPDPVSGTPFPWPRRPLIHRARPPIASCDGLAFADRREIELKGKGRRRALPMSVSSR
jgi:YD repeat-containing protein